MGDSLRQLQRAMQQQIEALSGLPRLQQPDLINICKAVFGVDADNKTLSNLFDLCLYFIDSSNGSSDSSSSTNAVTAAVVAWIFLKNGKPSQLILQQFVQSVFLPLAIKAQSRAEGEQQLQQLADLLGDKQAWPIVLEVMQSAHDTLQATLLEDSQNSGSSKQQPNLQLSSKQLPPLTACYAIKQLAAASRAAAQSQQQLVAANSAPADTTHAAQAVLALAAGPLFQTMQQLLCCANSSLRQATFQQLLPELLQAADELQPSEKPRCMQQLFQQCLDMLSQPVLPRRMGLAVLLQYWSDWDLQPPAALPPAAPAAAANATCNSCHESITGSSSSSSSARFWLLLRGALVDAEPLNRKRALRLLQLLLPKSQLQSEPVWGVLLALYELLEEFTPHLVKASWPLISQLHPAAPEFAAEDAEADVAKSKKLNLLNRGSRTAQQQQQHVGQVPLAFCWSSTIWIRALQHRNLQVQRMAMKTLLKRAWCPEVLSQVPVTFLTQVFLPALSSPVHHRTLGSGIAPTGVVLEPNQQQQQRSFDLLEQAGRLLSGFVKCAGPAAARELFLGGLQVAAVPGQELSRSGLTAVLKALAAAATMAVKEGGLLRDLSDADAEAYAESSLRQLQSVLTRFMPWHGPQYKTTACSLLLQIAAAVAPPGSCSLAACARLVQDMPAWMLGPGGPLNPECRAWWLGGSNSGGNGGGSSSSSQWLVQGISSMWQQYFQGSHAGRVQGELLSAPQQQRQSATAADYALWRLSSDAWVRVMACCGEELQEQLSAASSDLSGWLDQLSRRSYLAPGWPDRVLIVLTQLLEAAETAARVSAQQQQQNSQQLQLPAITEATLKLVAGPAGPQLGRLLELYCCCYRISAAELATISGSSSKCNGSDAAGTAKLGLQSAAWEAAAKAETAAQAGAAAAVLLARYVAVADGTSSSNTGVAEEGSMPAKRALSALLQLLNLLVEAGQQIVSKPLPSGDAATTGAGVHGKIDAAAAAAVAEQSRASAIRTLRHISLGLSRVLTRLPEISSRLTCAAPTWVDALLRETQAAQAAHTQWQPVLAATDAAGDPLAGWIEALDWPCLDALLSLAALIAAPTTNISTMHPSTPTAAAAAAKAAVAAGGAASEAERLPAGLLSDGVVVRVLVEALDALQWTSADSLMNLLRCLRRVWALIANESRLQVAAAEALAASGNLTHVSFSSSSSSDDDLLSSIAATISRCLLEALRGSKKRPLLLCGSLVSCLLLPELLVFDPVQQPQLVSLHQGPEAPLRQFLQGVLQQGAKGSPTLYLVVALRLCACVPAAPQLLVWYPDELLQLVLFGATMEGGPEAQASHGFESAQEWSLLSEALEPELHQAYIMAGLGPRVTVVAALNQLAAAAGLMQTAEDQAPTAQHRDSSSGTNHRGAHGQFAQQAADAGVALWRKWVQAALHDPVLSAENFKHGSDVHRSKVRIWQGIMGATAFLTSCNQEAAAADGIKELLSALTVINPPSIKQYQEAATAYLLLKHPTLLDQLLLPELDDIERGGPATASHILIAVQVALHCTTPDQLIPYLMRLLLPWTNHHTHNIRVFAQLGMCALLEARALDSWPAWQQALGPGGVDMLRALQKFFVGNADFQRFRQGMGAGMLGWSPEGITGPRRIFCSSLSLAGAEDASACITFEGCRQSLMDTVMHFLAEERAKLREAAADRAAGWDSSSSAAAFASSNDQDQSGAGGGAGFELDFQRKVTPSERAVLLADVLDDAVEAAAGAAPAGTRRHDLIIVASLIDKVPNLAGLARTAEVLGAGTLALSDLRVTGDQLFTSISVTAERWVPVIEVKEPSLLAWLQQQKARGYALVGLEQTAESTKLPSFKFAAKTVLVLGREKEGIPPEIIALLDATVEIPQLGVIRSLNVHVSGAIAMYEYTKQQLVCGK